MCMCVCVWPCTVHACTYKADWHVEPSKNKQADDWRTHAESGVGTLRLASIYWRMRYTQEAAGPPEQLPPPFRLLLARFHHAQVGENASENSGGQGAFELWDPERKIPSRLQCVQDPIWWRELAQFYDDCVCVCVCLCV